MNDHEKTQPQLIEELTEMRRTVAALRESKQRAALLEIVPLGIHECDSEGRITFVNPAQEAITGYTAEELLGTCIWDRVEPGPQKDLLPAYLRQLVSDQPRPTPYCSKNIRRNGEVFDIRVDWDYLRNPQGQVTGFVSVVSDITEQKKAETTLQQSRERYRTLAESTMDVVYIVDKNGSLLYANQSAAAYMGCPPSALVGKGQEDLFPPDMAKLHIERLRRVFETGEVGEDDELLRFGSEEVWLNIRSIPLRDEQGLITSVMGVCRNITDRKRAEVSWKKAHDELERRVRERTAELAKATETLDIFRKFAEASGEGFGMADLDGYLTYLNPALCRLFGEDKPEDALGKHVSTYYSEKYIHRREQEILPTLSREGRWHGEEMIRSRHGKRIPIFQSTFLIGDENRNPFRLASVITDITKRKQAEEALRQAHDKLQAIYDGMVDGLLIADIETKQFVRTNISVCRMLGYSEEELLSMSVMDIHLAADLPAILEAFQALAEGRLGIAKDLPVLRRDGSVFFANISTSGIVYNGRPCLIGFFRDISERKQAQEALQQEHRTLKHLLQSSDHEREIIAYDIHDGLAQQLAGAIMQFQICEHARETNPDQATKAYHGGVTLLHQSYAEARRIISGVRPPILDESGVVAAVAHLVHDPSVDQGPKIEFYSRAQFDRLPSIMENAIYRIVQEGLANARKHSKSPKVRISLLQRGDRVQIMIRDWGIGFDAKAVQGNRFGLEGIRQRARLLGGKCSIRSSAGKGTRITVELPVVLRD
jgi:PAS domain S-box-containing protein